MNIAKISVEDMNELMEFAQKTLKEMAHFADKYNENRSFHFVVLIEMMVAVMALPMEKKYRNKFIDDVTRRSKELCHLIEMHSKH